MGLRVHHLFSFVYFTANDWLCIRITGLFSVGRFQPSPGLKWFEYRWQCRWTYRPAKHRALALKSHIGKCTYYEHQDCIDQCQNAWMNTKSNEQKKKNHPCLCTAMFATFNLLANYNTVVCMHNNQKSNE